MSSVNMLHISASRTNLVNCPQWDEHHSVCTHSLTNFKWISKLHSKIQGKAWRGPKNVNVNIFCGQKANTFAQIWTLSGLCRIPSSHFTGIACKACIASSVVTTIEQGMTTRNLTANARLKHRSGFHSVAFFLQRRKWKNWLKDGRVPSIGNTIQ